MNKFLILLLAFFRPAVDGADPDPQDDPADQNLELDLDASDPDADPQDEPAPDAGKEELEAARRDAKDAKERAERFEREAAELRVRHAPRATDDVDTQENARLADPKTTDLEKWQIQSNRALRANTNAAQSALAQAHDVSDRTSFSSIAMTDPTAKKYETRVEKELADMRAKGQNAPREAIYTYLLGKDMREGKFKKKAAPAADGKSSSSAVNRGKLPGARSDVNARTGLSEHEKRAKRLENVQI